MFALTLSLSPSVPLSPFFLLYCSPSLFFFFFLQPSFSKDLSEAVEQKTARGNNFRILSPPPFPLLPVSQTHECAVHLHFRYQAVVLVPEWAGIRIVSGIEFMTNLLFVLRHMRRVFSFFLHLEEPLHSDNPMQMILAACTTNAVCSVKIRPGFSVTSLPHWNIIISVTSSRAGPRVLRPDWHISSSGTKPLSLIRTLALAEHFTGSYLGIVIKS